MLFRLAIIAACVWLGPQGLAQTLDPGRLEQLEEEQRKAEAEKQRLEAEREAAETQILSLQDELVRVAAEAQRFEQAENEAKARLGELQRQEEKLSGDIEKDRAALTDLLAALQRVERNPPPALATQPENAKRAAQAAILMGALSEQLSERARALNERLSNLQSVRRQIEAEIVLVSEARADLDRKRAEISRLVETKQSAEKRLGIRRDEADARARRAASEADNIRELVSRFEAEARLAQPRLKPDPVPPRDLGAIGIPVPRLKPRPDAAPVPLRLPPDTLRFADARGQLGAPAQGRLMRRYGQKEANGESAKGLTLATSNGAQVLAPYHGRVEFAGAFKDYGQVVIINAGDGYFLLLTGLGEVFAAKNSTVRAGEPIGRMPGMGRAELYIEFRKDSRPINPAPWLGANFAQQG